MHSKSLKLRSILTLLVLLLAAVALLNRTATIPVSADTGSSTVIVEFNDDPAAVYQARAAQSGQSVSSEGLQAYRDGLRAKQDEFLKALTQQGINFAVRTREVKNYDGSVAAKIESRYTLVYNGIALSVPKSAIASIEGMTGVKNVHLNSMLFTQLNRSVDYVRAPQVYGAVKELTQFDDLREGYEGQGINVAVIDTGIDWTHPMFGGDPTPPRLGVAPAVAAVSTNEKVIYNLPLTDSHVGDGFGHGTHVASTVAGYLALHPGTDGLPGTIDDVRLHGVAPQAKLMTYTVCSTVRSTPGSLGLPSVGGCEQADILTALEDAVSPFTLTLQPKPVAHVINMSLGGAGGPDTPSAVAATNAALTGATVVAASGNSGPGEGTTGSPAAGTHVISVAANTHPGGDPLWSTDVLSASAVSPTTIGAVTPAKDLPAASGFNRLKLFPMAGTPAPPANSMAQRYVFVNNPGATWPVSVRGRIALVKNTGLPASPFAVVSNLAAQSGAVGVIYISTLQNPTAVKGTIPSANILPEDGEVLIDAISSTDNNAVDPANGTVSELPVRMNPFMTDKFMGEIGGFSSRGPVRGFGQIKPDVSAPGVAVLAAVPPASVLGAVATAVETTPNYMHLDGTSMASPHVAGAVALIKQAHPGWSPDMIRTALINTATNMRNESGTPKADGPTADSIIAQGGGLIDVHGALNTKALMGIKGDGINTPGILGSHSYGEVPVINSRVTHTVPVTVTVRDLSNQGGTYNLRVANNRELERNGVSVSLSSASVNVPAGGTATYTVNATVDGNVIRDVTELIQLQWYVVAESAGAGQTLRMPFYMKPSRSLPSVPQSQTQTITDIMPAMDAGTSLVEGVTYKDIPVNLNSSALALEGTLEFLEVADSGVNDLDFYLFDPDGNQVGLSGVPGGPEYIKIIVTRPGTYTWRVTGFANAPGTEFTLRSTQTLGSAPPVLSALAGDFTNAQGKPVDFDGSVNLSWQGAGGETGYEVEHSTNGANYTLVASLGADQASLVLTNQPNGENFYRVRALTPGQVGSYVTPSSNAQSVVVDRRSKVDITSQVTTAMSNVSFVNGVFKLDLNLKNNSTSTYVPLVELNVVRISSASGTVSVKNADNSGDGKSAATAALFGYSNLLGADQEFAPAESTGNRSLEFNDSSAEMFTFDIKVTGFQRGAGGSSATSGGGTGTSAGTDGGSETGTSLQSLTQVLRITVNPLTQSVTAKLL